MSTEELNKKTKAELIEHVAIQEQKLDELQNTINEQEGIIAELNTANAKTVPAVSKSQNTIIVDGKRYAVRLKRFIHKGVEYTDQTITTQIAKELLEKRTSVLKAL